MRRIMSLLSIKATKPVKGVKVGVTLGNLVTANQQPAHQLLVTKIAPDSVFANTMLQEGFQVLKINDIDVSEWTSADAVPLLRSSEKGEIHLLVRERYGKFVSATIVKSSPEMKVGVIFRGNESVYIKEFIDTSPFKGKLPTGPEYQVISINDIPTRQMDATNIKTVLNQIKTGPVTIAMESVDFDSMKHTDSTGNSQPTNVSAPPGAPSGGQWGTVKFHGPKTNFAVCIGCLVFGVPGLLVLCCPCDEKNVYRANNGTVCFLGTIAST